MLVRPLTPSSKCPGPRYQIPTLHILSAPPAHPQRPLGGSVAPNLAARRHFPRPGERREDAKVLGILDAPGTRRPPPPAQPRGSRAAQPARCGLAAGSHPSPHKALRGKRLGFTFFFFFLTSKIGAKYWVQNIRTDLFACAQRRKIREARGLVLPENLSTASPSPLYPLPSLPASYKHPSRTSSPRASPGSPNTEGRDLGLLCRTGSGPKARIAYAQLARLGSLTQPSFGVRFGERLPRRMPPSPDSEP